MGEYRAIHEVNGGALANPWKRGDGNDEYMGEYHQDIFNQHDSGNGNVVYL